MIKEEWRMHSSIFGGFMFFLFPFMVAAFAAAGMAALPVFRAMFPSLQVSVFGQYMFLLFGLSVGSFGLMGREFMNRRFGHASLLAYSSRSLPVSERQLFANFIAKDVIFYFFLWILPFTLGVGISSIMIPIAPAFLGVILISTSMSFLLGLSISFALSTLYVYSRPATLVVLVLAGSAAAIYGPALAYTLPSLGFMLNPNMPDLALSICISAVLVTASLIFMRVDYPENRKSYGDSFSGLSGVFSFSRHGNFIAKDFIDMSRSEGGMGKIIFSFIFPVAIIWFMLSVFLRFVPQANSLVIFSVFLGVISSTVYNWLTEYDLFGSYSFLPLKVSDVIKSKIISYYMLNVLSIIILAVAAAYLGYVSLFPASLLLMICISTYALSVTIYLTGLHPNIMLYNAGIFLKYIIMNSSLLLVFIFLTLVDPALTLCSLALVPLSVFLLARSFVKWDRVEQLSF